ncbi:AraC-like DNA-binding protein [Chitinophaga skermanii]|uniref:AraC-like DNA-binding protein n=1 Tax=Chitinophaga skermanii TaxID=331697 RepID=A0A327Q6U4_9BACT|nr:helix-turn-helix domain-containing protein [Chitinophaga skermanii]RAI97566.1 AraC-like DNA-binding protein [Chitinophaga skermanii]
MSLDVFSLLVLLGAVQGLALSLYLFFSKPTNRLQQYSLAGMMLILSYNGFETVNWSAHINSNLFYWFTFVSIFGIGPCFYLYILSFSEPQPSKQLRWLFFPVGLNFMLRLALIAYLFYFVKVNANGVHPLVLDDWYSIIAEPLSVVYFIVFVWLSRRALLRYYESRAGILPEIFTTTYKWLRALWVCMLILGIIWPVTIIAPYTWKIPAATQYYLAEILLVFFIYYVAFAGFQRTKVIVVKEQKQASQALEQVSAVDIEKCKAAILRAMQHEKLYRSPELDLSTLSEAIQFPPKTVSAVINQAMQKGFNELINEYRVADMQSMLIDPQMQHLTIASMGYECGFNSQATFQRAFKQIVGCTPKQYIEKERLKAGKE